MKVRVYIETTVVSYLTAWPSRDIVLAGHQQVTRDWWKWSKERFELVASELVVREASAGDSDAARERVSVLSSLSMLEASPEALALAEELTRTAVVPPEAADDALHLAIAATNGVDYLVTWNCRHLANATMRARIDGAIREAGYEPPVVCTPEELWEIDSNV